MRTHELVLSWIEKQLSDGHLVLGGRLPAERALAEQLEVSRTSVREAIRIPLFLAGGLTPANLAEAMAAVEPFGLDVCSGVRTNDVLDPGKLRAFFAALPVEAT